MTEQEIIKIADDADLIVRGIAFKKRDNGVFVVNLNHPTHAMLISLDDVMLETNMDPIEQAMVMKTWKENRKFMEEDDAEVLSA